MPADPAPGPRSVGSPAHGITLRPGREATEAIEAFTAALGVRVGLTGMLPGLDRRLARSRWHRLLGRTVSAAWRLPRAEQRDRRWWPQGIATAPPTWQLAGHELLLTSAYSRELDGERHGSRLSVLDLATGRLGHVLLVHPDLPDGGTLRPVLAHAGGIVWTGNTVHVAATARGFHSFDVRDIVRLDAPARDRARGYEYVLPLRRSWRAAAEEGTEKLRYSFMSLDGSGAEPVLLVGEYGRNQQSTRLASFAVAPGSGDPAVDEHGTARPLTLQSVGVQGMQGVARVRGRGYLSTSHGPWRFGTLLVGRPGALRPVRWALPMGPEDLAHRPGDDTLWTVTEHPWRRWVVQVDRAAVERRLLRQPAPTPPRSYAGPAPLAQSRGTNQPRRSLMQFSYRLTGHSTANPEQLFALLSDAPTWPSWTKVVPSARWVEGSGGPGSVRRMGSGRLAMQERVIAEDPPLRHEYGIDATFPAKGYRAVVEFSPAAGGGTDVVWSGSFEALPGVGHAYRAVLAGGIVKRLLADLVKAAAR